jgi:hypothetical protein
MSEFTTVQGSTVIRVDKVGGGTVGRRYDGDWEVTVSDSATVVLDDIISTGTPKTHREVSELALDFVDDADVID